MNIFMLDNSPEKCARYHNDKHTVKMILEYAQLLSTAHRILDGVPSRVEYLTSTGKSRTKTVYTVPRNDSILYAATHINHPSAVWVRESDNNYQWLYTTAKELCKEYTRRYERRHKTEDVIDALFSPPKNIPQGPMTTLPLAMPKEYQKENPVAAYRNYYRLGKAHIANWDKLNNTPEWFLP